MMMPAMTQPRLGGLRVGLGVARDHGSLVPGRQKKLLLRLRPALPALSLLLLLTWSQVQVAAGAAITFTGLVTRDMPAGPGVFIATDGANDVFFPHLLVPTDPYSPSVNDPTGFNLYDVRFAYDASTDTAYFGVNTGPCITGDADCDGDPGRASAALIAADNTAVDQPLLDKGEFAVILVDFGKNNTAVYTPSTSNPSLAVLGVPSSNIAGAETLASARFAKVNGQPRNQFGVSIPGVGVSVFNYVANSTTQVGPTSGKPHLEFTVTGYSLIPLNLATTSPDVIQWDPIIACIALSANIGSSDDGPVGEDALQEQQNCPSPSATPSPTTSPTVTPSPSATRTYSPSFSVSPSSSASPTPTSTSTSTSTSTASMTSTTTNTRSSSRTPSPSKTFSRTRSASKTSTRTRSVSRTPSKTRTQSKTASRPASRMPPASPSLTPSRTTSRTLTTSLTSSKSRRV